ncbi:hypothetical protein INT43_002240 [Umbelopsis isabellina]|uniref:D-lactate dehydrogenase (cytochrome) n=1 Tax=Mortierella isabellina TaxID=91625 RepID=A0A8H7Q5T7_MORIS|nr:hypothetical protein INT43_002240 [Umbelopsis isabellina]
MNAKQPTVKVFSRPVLEDNGSKATAKLPAAIVNAIEVNRIDECLYNSRELWKPIGARGVFGGQVVAQALRAAAKTVDPSFYVHSLHCYFILAGDNQIPILFQVDRLRSGKTYATRVVKATQRGRAIFTASVSFSLDEPGPMLHHQPRMPDVPPPEEIPTEAEKVNAMLKDESLDMSQEEKDKAVLRMAERAALDTRQIDTHGKEKHYRWIKTQGTVDDDDRTIHACIAAYASDTGLIGTAARIHNLKSNDIGLMVSLDHQIWFHAPFRTDEWLLYEMVSPTTNNGRALCMGQLYTRDGRLVATTVMLNSAIRHSLLRQARRNAQQVARRAASTAVPTAPGKPWPIVIGAAAASGAAGYWYANANASTSATPMTSAQPAAIANKVDAKAIQTAFTRLQQVLPAEHVTVDQETLQFHGFTTNSYHNEGAPNIVVYPQSTDDVVKIINIANELKVPVIPVAGLTSLEGHFSAPYGGICISFGEHMDEIVAFHEEDMDIVVQPGVGWETLNAFLKPHGLFFPLDPGPGACIGGMVGTGCSGTNAVRYGTMREWVLNVTAVMPDGSVVKTRQRPRKSSAGYDLTKLFIGSEGTLGVVTEITLKLATIPKETSVSAPPKNKFPKNSNQYPVAVCDFPSIRDAAAVVPDIMKAGIQVGAVELLDEVMMKAINMANPRLGYEEEVTLFFKFSGPNKTQVQNDIKLVSEIVNKHKGGKFKYAKTDVEKEELWEGRKVALWSSALLKPGCSIWTTDVVVPVSRLPDLIEQTKQDIATSFLPCPMVGHVGDGNFHVFILFDRDNEKETAEAKRLNARLVDRAIELEGSCTGEHAVGIGKKNYLNKELGVPTVELMRTIKAAVDPNGIMNPGKILPDLEKPQA